MLSWHQFFPFLEIRPEQAQALDWICEQFATGHRTVIAELGTGVGKSAIAACLARWIDTLPLEGDFAPGAVALTSQKTLQDQYTRDFAFARDLRSATNFTCHGPIQGTCGEARRVRKAVGVELSGRIQCNQCPYRAAKDDFVAAPMGITNYSYSLSESTYAGELPRRRLIVCDEAHNLEDEVRRWATVEVTEADAKELQLALPPLGSATEWLGGAYRDGIGKKLGTVGKRLKRIVRDNDQRVAFVTVRELGTTNDRLDKRLCQVNRILNNGLEVLVSEATDRKKRRSLRFQPVDVTGLVEEALLSRSAFTLLTSATLLDGDLYRKTLGIPEAPFLSIPSPFPAEAFGVRFRPVGKMTYNNIEASLRDLPRTIRKILAENPDAKGIIHTVNYRITKAIGERVRDDRLLVQDGAGDREGMLREHISSPRPTVLVSPSMMEGLDLRDDLGRFQVVCKVPYPDYSDPLVGRKDRDWYDWRTVRSLVQAVGRGVRSQTDYTKTYITDLSFYDLLERRSHMFPRHLREGITVEEP